MGLEGVKKILFFPHVPYHANTFIFVIKELNDCEAVIVYADHLKHYGSIKIKESNIKKIASENNIRAIPYTPKLFFSEKPNILVVMNDWGGWPKRAVEDAKKMGIITIGHIEGAQDYLDTHLERGYIGKKRYPYQKVDYIFLLGEYDKQFFDSKETKLTGSPRFDKFAVSSNKIQNCSETLIGINCNFSYGIFSDISGKWINDVITAIRYNKVNYQISQHIGDTTSLNEYNIYSGGLYDLIEESSILISRFSTAIIEALLLGCPVIYYNPHNEKQPTFLDSMGAFPMPTNVKELRDSITDVLSHKREWLKRAEKFLNYHVAFRKGGSAISFAKALKEVSSLKIEKDTFYPFRSTFVYFYEKIKRILSL